MSDKGKKPAPKPSTKRTPKPAPKPATNSIPNQAPKPTTNSTPKPAPKPTNFTPKSVPEPSTRPTTKPTSKPNTSSTAKPRRIPKPAPKLIAERTSEPVLTPITKSTPKSAPDPSTRPTTKPTSKPTAKPKWKPTPEPPLKSPKSWSMHPSYHDPVADLLEKHSLFFNFHEDDDSDCDEEWDTNIMGHFTCHNRRCRTNGWSSKKIAITIRMYFGKEYNARVYHQRCRACNELSEPELDDSYAERVAYRLKKWCGVKMETPQYSGQSSIPHMSDLCEGCKHGHCTG